MLLPDGRGGKTIHESERYSTQPVGYVVYLTALYLSFPEIGEISVECIIDRACQRGSPVRERMRHAAAVMRGIAAGAAVLVTALFSAHVLVALLAGLAGMVLMPMQWDTPAALAGVLLLAHAALAAVAWQRPSVRVGILSGLALGALILVRSIYLYSLIVVPLVWLVGIWLIPSQRRRTAPAFVALTLSACIVVGPWMARNWVQGGAFAVSAGGGEVLAIRAEYGLMTWPEVGRAFVYFLSNRFPFKAAAMRLASDPTGMRGSTATARATTIAPSCARALWLRGRMPWIPDGARPASPGRMRRSVPQQRRSTASTG